MQSPIDSMLYVAYRLVKLKAWIEAATVTIKKRSTTTLRTNKYAFEQISNICNPMQSSSRCWSLQQLLLLHLRE